MLHIYVQNCTAEQKRVKVENINDTVLLFYAKDRNRYWSIILKCLLYFIKHNHMWWEHSKSHILELKKKTITPAAHVTVWRDTY